MNEFEKSMQAAGITILDQGTCGKIESTDVIYYRISGAQISQAWHEARKLSLPAWPIITYEEFNDGEFISENTSEIANDLTKLENFDINKWITERTGEYDFDNEYDEWEEIAGELDGPLPEAEPTHQFSIPYDILTKEPHSSLWLVMVPKIPFHLIPIYMQYGGWNACPYPHEITAILKHWHDSYGAELAAISHDIIELAVKNPPDNYDDAYRLAKEQFAFCDDIVSQGTMTTERLAKGLIGSSVWFFWWD